MADRMPRHLLVRARWGAGGLIVLLGLLLATAVPSVALAATASGTAGDTRASGMIEVRPSTVTWTSAGADRSTLVAATTDATPAPGATPKPGEPGTTDTAGWNPSTPDPFASLAPLILGAVVLVIMVALIAMSFGVSTEERSTGH